MTALRDPASDPDLELEHDCSALSDEDTLRCATALFVSPIAQYSIACISLGEAIGFPEILQCDYIVSKPWDVALLGLTASQQLLRYGDSARPSAYDVAYLILKAVDLPEDATESVVAKIGNRFTCSCGQGAYAKTHRTGFLDIVSTS